ncbi:MAG: NAD(P)/FAD-dependent oxidoreductase, partial [Phycisphaerales bacterium]|nr:NAD(P)/FAD-dependent oxidoreductase [Phycisphaerales bacterium]
RRTMTRREALKASAGGFAAVLAATRLGGCASDRSARMDGGRPARRPNGKSVIVVGAGFAGLACAYELLEFGYEVEVIEARDRIGGRVLSFKDFVPGKVVEGGGELIGSNHFTWLAYAQQFGLRMLDVTSEDELAFPVRLNGRMLDEPEAERLWVSMDAALSTMNDAAVPISGNEPWTSIGAEDLDRSTVAGWINALNTDEATRQVLRIVLASDNAVPVENQSLLGMLAQVAGGGGQSYWEDSEVYRCRGGNQQLADKLLDRIQGYRVLRGTPVASIEYENVAKVTLADGRVRAADYVVLAVPPSVWTRIFFVPLLPDRLAPQMGTALKYLSAVKSRYWRDLGLAPDSLTDGPVAMTWNGTDNQGGGNASLHVFSGGSAAQWLREGTRQEVDARVTRELESIYPGYEANLLTEARGGPRRFMDWPADQWCGAGYSFPAPGQLTRTGPILHEGINRLRFCGEHTCPAFVGYMEGALRSGVLLAQRMALGDGSTVMPERMAAGV